MYHLDSDAGRNIGILHQFVYLCPCSFQNILRFVYIGIEPVVHRDFFILVDPVYVSLSPGKVDITEAT